MGELPSEQSRAGEGLRPVLSGEADQARAEKQRRALAIRTNAEYEAMSPRDREWSDRIIAEMNDSFDGKPGGADTSSAVDDPFAPLPPTEEDDKPKPADEIWEPQMPAPVPIPALEKVTWPGYGTATWSWPYRDADGAVLFVVMRFERTKPDGTVQKETIPYTYGFREWTTRASKRVKKTQWHAKRPCVPVPLYGLDRLVGRLDAPVILVEGEKTADAGVDVFRDYVVVCSQGGSNGAGKADWTPLAGRAVIIWPDNDAPGRKYAKAAKAALIEVGAADVCTVDVPEDWPDGWDIADPVPDGDSPDGLIEMIADARKAAADPEVQTVEFRAAEIERLSKLSGIDYQTLRKDAASDLGLGVTALDKLVKSAKARRHAEAAAEFRSRPEPDPGETVWPMGFRMKRGGLIRESDGDNPDIWICPPFEVLGEVRDTGSAGWGLWLRWSDRDGQSHTWPMPNRLLMLSPGELEAELVDRGLRVSADPAARAGLRQALSDVKSGNRVRSVDRAGWHIPPAGASVFTLPNGDVIGHSDEQVVLARISDAARQMTSAAGSLETWKSEVASVAVGNPILAFCMCAAFAGPLLSPLEEVSGGFHLVGRSKIGKTLAAIVAATIWGSPRKGGIVRDWRSTSNGMELAASESNDGLLVLDEIHQVEPRDLVSCVYMLMNEAGKQRATKQVTAAAKKVWAVIVISNGETDLASIVAKAGHALPAGAQVRMPSLPVTEETMWPQLHGNKNVGALMATLHKAIPRAHGTAGRAYLERLVSEWTNAPNLLRDGLAASRAKFAKMLPQDADSQVRDVARRFALLALAGELATNWGILPWQPGEAIKACKAVLTLWIKNRGGSAAGEESQHIRIVRQFIALHGASRFVHIQRSEKLMDQWDEVNPERQVLNRAGWRRNSGDGRDEYLIQRDVWRHLCAEAQANATEVAKTLKTAGYLEPGDGSNLAKAERVPGTRDRFYVVKPDLMSSENGEPL